MCHLRECQGLEWLGTGWVIHVLTSDWEARRIMLCENELSESGAVLADIGKTESHANIICSIKPRLLPTHSSRLRGPHPIAPSILNININWSIFQIT